MYVSTSKRPFHAVLLSLMDLIRSSGVAGTKTKSGESPSGNSVGLAAIIVSKRDNLKSLKCFRAGTEQGTISSIDNDSFSPYHKAMH